MLRTIAPSAVFGSDSCFLAVTVHGMSGLAFSTVLQLIYHSSAPSSGHSTYTPLSYILSNALAFTYVFLFKSVAVIGISH